MLDIIKTMAATYKCPDGTSTTDVGSCVGAAEGNTLMDTVGTIINVIIGVIGVVAVVMIVLGGVTFTLSQGDPQKTKRAKDTILYGVVGLIVALLAFAIVNFVLSGIFGGDSEPGAGGVILHLWQ